MKQKLLILLTLLTFCTAVSSAQRNYPVRATVQYTPPYSLFLGDYATPKLIITLTGQDLLDANCPYKLSFSLECQNVKVTTKPSFNPAPLYINGGQTIVLTGADLARYFDIQNLDFHGITAAKYLQDGQLPEGFYRMNVKVIHYHENRVISNTAFTMFNARMGKPPVLSLPKNKTLIPPAQQQSPIVFTWIPKTVGAFNYKFELWECAVPGIPVQTVVSTVRPIYSQTYTTSQISFHPATVNMKPGMEYAWRITVEDPHNQQKFANQGQSEIFTFTYKRKPEPVTGLRFSNRGLKITWTWDMDPAHTKYYFEYYDPQTGRTIDPVACDYAEFVRNMPQTGYHLKVRVKAECYGDPTLMSDYTPYLDTYLEPIPVPEYECGKVFEDREITNLELKHTFSPGEIVESKNGDTRYEIIFSEEKNGYLSGQFYMIMDCWGGAKIKCEFSKTQINTDNIVLNTIFHNVPDSTLYVKPETIRKEIQEAFFDAATVLTDFSIKDTVKLDKPYTYLYVNPSGKVMAVIDDKGKIKTEETNISATNLKENTLIQGKNGEELVLTKKGQVMGKNEFNATGGNSVLLKEYHRKSDSLAQWQINFSKYDAQTYAFDHIGSGNHGIFSGADYYPQVGSYDFRYKSVECGKNDKVIVEFDTYPQADSVVFKDKYGVTYPIKDRILTFTGVSKADTNFIYAYRGDQKIGKLFLNTYQKKTYKVVLISVNGAKLPNVKDLENYLNKVYRQCADSFKIETRKLQVSGIENFTHGGTKVAGSVWNASQKAVLEAFGEKYEDNTAYLFFIPKAETGGVAGYMPRYYSYGFIYPGAANRTIAHELGHGIAGLEHPFPESQVSGNTANLMDYRDGTELWHFQWDMLQDPSRKIFKWWQNEEGAEDLEVPAFKGKCFAVKKQGWENYAFLSPNGAAIIIPDVTDVYFNQDGAVLNFYINNTHYLGVFSANSQTFYGYIQEGLEPLKRYIYDQDGNIIDEDCIRATKETLDQLNKYLYTGIKFAPKGTTVVSIYQEKENNRYIDCYSCVTWENVFESVTYTGKANSRLTPGFVPISFTHIKGNDCNIQNNQVRADGLGYELYTQLINGSFDNNQKQALAEMCNLFTEMTKDIKSFAFYTGDFMATHTGYVYRLDPSIPVPLEYDENDNMKYVEVDNYSISYSIIKYFKENKIYSVEAFNKFFPKSFDCRDFDIVFSSVDLWDGISKTYNENAFDSKGEKFVYSFRDLILRRVYIDETKDRLFATAISEAEKKGRAFSLNAADDYTEYVKRYGTNSAIFAWSKFAVTTAEPIIKAKIAAILVGSIPPELLVKFFIDNIEKDFAKKFFIGFFLSASMDVGMDYLVYKFFDEDTNEFQVNVTEIFIDALMSGFQSAMKVGPVKDVTIDVIVSLEVSKLIDLFYRVVIENKKFEQKDYDLLNQQLFNMALAAGTSGALKSLGKVFQKCKPIFKKKFNNNNNKAVKYLTNKGLDEETSKKIVDKVNKATPEGPVTKSNNESLIVVKNTDIPLSNYYPENEPYYNTFVQYYSDVDDLEVLAKFQDKKYLDTWNKMVESNMPEEWCKEAQIIELFNSYPTYSDIWNKMKKYNNLPNTWLDNVEVVKIFDNNPQMMDLIESGFDVKLVNSDINELQKISNQYFVDAFKQMKNAGMPWTNDLEVIKKVEQDLFFEKKWYDLPAGENLISIYKKIKDAGLPSEWYSQYSDFTRFINKSDLFIQNWKILKDKKITINDFSVFDKISSNDISLNNIELIFDGKLNDDVIKVLKSNDNLTITDIRELVGDFEGLAVYSPYNFHRLYEGVKNMSLGLKCKLQNKAVRRYVVTNDLIVAFFAELVSYPLATVLSEAINAPLDKREPNFWTAFKVFSDFEYYESALRNALQSQSSISSKNTISTNLKHIFLYVGTCVEYKTLLSSCDDHTLLLLLVKCTVSVLLDYFVNPHLSNSDTMKRYIRTIVFQIGKDFLQNEIVFTDKHIEELLKFINDKLHNEEE